MECVKDIFRGRSFTMTKSWWPTYSRKTADIECEAEIGPTVVQFVITLKEISETKFRVRSFRIRVNRLEQIEAVAAMVNGQVQRDGDGFPKYVHTVNCQRCSGECAGKPGEELADALRTVEIQKGSFNV